MHVTSAYIVLLPPMANGSPNARLEPARCQTNLEGVSGSRKLRSILARLESKQQALVFGQAVPMPVVIQTREYGTPESYKALGFVEAAEMKAQVERDIEDLFDPREA